MAVEVVAGMEQGHMLCQGARQSLHQLGSDGSSNFPVSPVAVHVAAVGEGVHTVRSGSTAKVPAECKVKYYRISGC